MSQIGMGAFSTGPHFRRGDGVSRQSKHRRDECKSQPKPKNPFEDDSLILGDSFSTRWFWFTAAVIVCQTKDR